MNLKLKNYTSGVPVTKTSVKPEPVAPRIFFGFEGEYTTLCGAFPDMSRAAHYYGIEHVSSKKVEFIELTPEVRQKLGL